MQTHRPLCIDLFSGLGGWSAGFLAEGFDCVGFDIEEHVYGAHRYPAQVVLQDVLTVHGSQFRDAACIVASPPCQEFSYMAMPWTRGKQIARALRGTADFPEDYTGSRTIAQLTALFDACFRIQREACAAAGRHIPMVVENVLGASKWVGRYRRRYGSFCLWGDIPALMPVTSRRSGIKTGTNFRVFEETGETSPAFNGVKVGGLDCSNRAQKGQAFNTHAERATKNEGGSWFAVAHNTTSGHSQNPDGRKVGGGWFHDATPGAIRSTSSKSAARKAASARIARIPFPLARHIAQCFLPTVRPTASEERERA